MSGFGIRRCCCNKCPGCGPGVPYSDSTFTNLNCYTIGSSNNSNPASPSFPNFFESSGRLRCESQSDPYVNNEDDGRLYYTCTKPTGDGWTISVKAKTYSVINQSTMTIRTGTVGVFVGDVVVFFAIPKSSVKYGYRGVNASGDIATGPGLLVPPAFTTIDEPWAEGDELEILVTENGGVLDVDLKVNGTTIHTDTGLTDDIGSGTFNAGVFVSDSAEWDDLVIVATNGS